MFFLKQCLLIASLLWTCAESSRSLEAQRQVISLLPFDVRIAFTKGTDTNQVNMEKLKQLVTQWMDDSYNTKSQNQELLSDGATFEYTLLEIFSGRRSLQENSQSIEAEFYRVIFQGFSVWNLEGPEDEVNPDVSELIQRATHIEETKLLQLFRQTSDAGLGGNVLDVKVEDINPDDLDDDDVGSPDKSLEIIITVAIVVACLAFCLLIFAVAWAWRTDRSKREAYKAGRNPPGVMPDRTGTTESDPPSPPQNESPKERNPSDPPSEIPAISNYPERPESVISEDVETSFTAYYNSTLQNQTPSTPSSSIKSPVQPSPAPSARYEPKAINDGASVSSMDSYGFSLDGYASSMGGQKYPGGALSMPNNPNSQTEPDSDADLAPSENGDYARY